jgi:hypothetical protein
VTTLTPLNPAPLRDRERGDDATGTDAEGDGSGGRIAQYDGGRNVFLEECIDQTLPKGPGEVAERTRWLGNQLPGNQVRLERAGLRS